MNCSSIDLKAHVLGELSEDESRMVAGHVCGCASCREEMERLNLTHLALMSLPDEEVPRRIAFVSGKVFEPRWWQGIRHWGPAMVFALPAVLACAFLASGFLRSPWPRAPVVAVDKAAVERLVASQVNERIDVAVARAVAETEARQQRKTAELLAAAEQKYDLQRRADLLAVQANLDILRKEQTRLYMASSGLEVRP